MSDFVDLPPEISLQIFPHLHLKALVAAEGVCRLWKHQISVADINPTRRALLNLYRKTINDPLFLPTRPWLLANLPRNAADKFDRQAYIDTLLTQHNYIPEDFRLWILEWPERAVIACAWPDLPGDYSQRGDDVERIVGCNFLARIPPVVHKISLDLEEICPPDISSDGGGSLEKYNPYSDDNHSDKGSETSEHSEWSDVEEYYRSREEFNYSPPPGSDSVELVFPALLIWERDDGRQTWLALDPVSPFSVYLYHYADYHPGESRQYISWISWLEAQLRRIHRESRPGCGPVSYPPVQIDGENLTEEQAFRLKERYEELWTVEDENSRKIYVP
ncbi:hypothetical protein DFH09DRAFT_1021400 [Mycena vulgaris]|nr:hypothetical protein DFH09DRAFT_1021400 [Mycena vulgaris]